MLFCELFGAIKPKQKERSSAHQNIAQRKEVRVSVFAKHVLKSISKQLDSSASLIFREVGTKLSRHHYKTVDSDNRPRQMVIRRKLFALELNLDFYLLAIGELKVK